MAIVRPVTARAQGFAASVAGLPSLVQDALLYGAAALFAGLTGVVAVTADYREWGLVAAGPYAAAAALCCVFEWRRRSAGRQEDAPAERRARHLLVVALLAAVVLVPLALLVTWRAESPGCRTNRLSAQAQPEVAVIERAGDRVANFEDPYLLHPRTVGVSPSNDCRSVDATSFFPYLPGMLPFGLVNSLSGVSRELTDVRIPLAGFTLLVVSLALLVSPASNRRRWRVLQFLVVLPTGALPMVTGGDDLPVLALLLLGLVLVERRQPVAAGLVMGVAGTLKWTAWPLIFLTLLCVRDEDERPAVIRYGLSALAVAVPVIAAGAALGRRAFLENTVLFPLGLTKVRSPAASPLPGQVIVQLFPAHKTVLTALLVGGAVVFILVALVRHPPRTASAAARFAGIALGVATFVAPATRFGYLIYPVNMLVWAYLLGERHDLLAPSVLPAPLEAQLASSTS